MYKKKKYLIKNDALSEIVSTVIMIAFAVSLFIPLNLIITSDIESSTDPSTLIVGQLVGDKIIIEHCGGPSLNLDTSCTVNIGGLSTVLTAEDLLNSNSKKNSFWDIGERLVYDLGDISYFQVSLIVTDKEKNSIICNGIIQDGAISNCPYIILTFNPTDIRESSANLSLGYNFRENSGSVRFSYKSYGGNWINTSWISKSGSGIYNETINGLYPDLIYIFKAELFCESNIINGEEKLILHYGTTSVKNITPSNISSPMLTVTADGSSILDKVNLFYRYSYDNVSWGKNWWHNSWKYRKLITIDSLKVAGDITNFPVLIYKTDDNDLASNAKDNGDDIAFISYYDNTTKLNHEIQSFDGSTGKIITWVNVPSLNSSKDTNIWMYYGNPNANNQENAPGVWDSNYVSVWHLDESPNDEISGHFDSTSNNNHGIPKNFQDGGGGSTDAIGKIGGANYFAGDDDWIEIPHSSSIVITGNQFSLSAWVKMTTLQDDDEGIVVKSDGSNYNMQLGIQSDERGNFRVKTPTGTTYLTGSTTLQVNQWYYLYGIYDGVTARVYINDFLDGSENRNGNVISPTDPILIGRRALGDNRFFKGIIDEVRISYSKHSFERFKTEYYNQNSPSTFYNIDNQEEYSGDWIKWYDIKNPDSSYPWKWDFNFPHGDGYYQFYSQGIIDNYVEITPTIADAFCYLDTP